MISNTQKVSIVCEIRELMHQFYAVEKLPKMCHSWAVETVLMLAKHGIRGVLQAGSASWPRVNPEQDDGVMMTHFSYVWEGLERAYFSAAVGRMPEMHCWVGIPETLEIVDLTTMYAAQNSKDLASMEWLGEKMPDHIWDKSFTFNKKRKPKYAIVYRAEVEAIEFAHKVLKTSRGEGCYA